MTKSILVPVVAGCVVQAGNTYLLVQERLPKAYGLWNLPAGHVDEGETFEEAAMREAKEEAGITVEIERKLSTTHQAVDRPVFHAYKAHITQGEVKIDPEELLDARWFTLDEVEHLHTEGKLRNIWVLESIRQAALA